jgi:hypothetical protein
MAECLWVLEINGYFIVLAAIDNEAGNLPRVGPVLLENPFDPLGKRVSTSPPFTCGNCTVVSTR